MMINQKSIITLFLLIVLCLISLNYITSQTLTPQLPPLEPIKDDSEMSKNVNIVDIPHGPKSTNQTLPCCNTCPEPKINVIPNYIYKKKVIYSYYPELRPNPNIPAVNCPEGYKKVAKDRCLKVVRTEQRCPPGFSRVDDETCSKMVETNVNVTVGVGCPPGFEHNKEKNTCEKITTKQDPDPLKCPPGYRRKGLYHCFKIVECPKKEGFQKITKDGKTYCMKKSIRCPPGYKRLGRDRCIQDKVKCPKGTTYMKKYNACLKKIIIIKKHDCPKGYTKKGKKCVLTKCLTVKCKNPNCKIGRIQYTPKGACCPVCKPCGCSHKFESVCGDDGITYPNPCIAKCFHKNIRHKGKCAVPPFKPCEPKKINKTCEQQCTKNYKPVCVNGNITFMNQCIAKCLKLKITHKGVCKKTIKCEAKKTEEKKKEKEEKIIKKEESKKEESKKEEIKKEESKKEETENNKYSEEASKRM